MSFLTVIQNAAKRLGVNSPSAAYTSTDPQIIQLVAFAQQEGVELMEGYDWQALTTETTFVATATAAQSGAIPSDFNRFVPETFFNRTRKRPVFGPISAQDWQFTQAVTTSTITENFRVRGDTIYITPTPTADDTYAYEYISNKWCESAGGTAQALWAADTDVGILSEEVMTLGIVWRSLRGSGFDYAEPFRTYEMAKMRAQGRDGSKRRINMGYRTARGPRAPYTPEGSWDL